MRHTSIVAVPLVFLLAGCGTLHISIEFDTTPDAPVSSPAAASAAGPSRTSSRAADATPSVAPTGTPPETVPAPAPMLSTAISAGSRHTCAVIKDGSVRCWGLNDHGQLGDGGMINSNVPVKVKGLGGVKAVALGWAHSCALTASGKVMCWGYNKNGELGNAENADSSVPVEVSGLSPGAVSIEAGDDHTCAVIEGGAVKCWGYNEFGQLGDGTKMSRDVPVEAMGITGGAVSVAAGWGHSCVQTVSHGMMCWGNNQYGQLGYGQIAKFRFTPVDVMDLGGSVIGIAVDGGHSCALTNGGGLKCWGNNRYGQLGNGTGENRYAPVDVIGMDQGVSLIVAGWNHTCAVAENGELRCWGWNYYGQLGDGTTVLRQMPERVRGLTGGVLGVGIGEAHTCVVTESGGVKCWGLNEFGQLGDGTLLNSTVPLNVAGLGPAVP